MGDAPYGKKEIANLPVQLKNLNSKAADFLVHLGDMQDRRKQCRRNPLTLVANILRNQSPLPTFIVPGDNDYHDCTNWRQGWTFWKDTFVRFNQNWKTPFKVRYQAAQPENFAFVYKRVLFVGIHTLHGQIKNQREWNRLQNNNVQWTTNSIERAGKNKIGAVVIFSHAYANKDQYAKLWEGLSKIGEQTKLPILYLQGDAHRWLQSTPFRANNILRTIVDRGGVADPVLITVDPTAKQVFRFQRRPLKQK